MGGMQSIQNVLVAGAGAIGSMVAWQIQQARPGTVGILAGGERLERYRSTGFRINGAVADFRLVDVAGRSAPDLVIVACKNHHLGQVIRDLANHVGPGTLILSLLNGISSEQEIGAAYGDWRIPYAMIIGTDAGHSAGQTSFSRTGTIFFGDARNDGPLSPRVAAIKDFFDRSGIAATVPPEMLNRLWFKFMMNVGLNQVTAVLRRPYRIFQSQTLVPEAAALMEAAMREVMGLARLEGIELTEADIATVYRTVDSLSGAGQTSMHQDVEAGRKTEVELFAGQVLALGRQHGVAVPVNQLLWQQLRAIEQSY